MAVAIENNVVTLYTAAQGQARWGPVGYKIVMTPLLGGIRYTRVHYPIRALGF